jgi:hypothetical protein
MAAENGTPPKGKARTDAGGRRRPEVTLDLEAKAAPKEPQAATDAAESERTAASAADPDRDAENRPGAEGRPASDPSAAPMSASPEPARERPGMVALVIAGVVGGVAALALGYGLQGAGVLPAPGEAAANQARAETEALKDSVSALDQRVTSIEAASAQAIADRALLDDLSRQVGVVDAFGESLSDRLLQAEAAIAALNEDGGDDSSSTLQTLDSLSKRVMRLETIPSPAADSDTETQQRLDALSERVARLEEPPSAVPSTTAPAPVSAPTATAAEIPAATTSEARAATATETPASTAPAADDPAARAAAIAAFQQAAAGSEPFSADLDKFAALGVAPEAIAPLKPLAEKGVPSRAELVAAFPEVADAILAAEPATEDDAGLLDRLASFGRNLVKVRPAGSQQAGDDTEAIVARMRAAVDAGDLAAALDVRKTLPADGQAASQAWADAAADRLEIDRLAAAIAAPPDTGNGNG